MDSRDYRRRFIEDISPSTNKSYGSNETPKNLNLERFFDASTPKPSSDETNPELQTNSTQPSRTLEDIRPVNRPARADNSSGSMLNATLPNSMYQGRSLGGTSFKANNDAKPKKKRWFMRHKLASSIILVFVVLLGIGGYFGGRLLGDVNKVLHGNIFSDVHALFSTTRLSGEAQGRVNILLAGYQGANSDEGALTDSIMLISIDTRNNSAFMLSVPRDLLVHIPGYGYQKINYANSVSNFNQPGYFKGGIGQLQEIIEHDFGIPVQYYALINYNAFESAVNAVGGITVNIQSPDPRGLYDPNVDKAHGGPVKLPNGPVTLNGLQALGLALARGDSPYAYGFPLSDINREQHQRQMLVALEKKALSAGVLSNPLDVTHLFDAIGNNVTTDLNLADVLRLAQLAKNINVSNIQSYGLSYSGKNNLLVTYYSPTAGDSLIPKAGLDNYSQIQSYYLSLTASENSKK